MPASRDSVSSCWLSRSDIPQAVPKFETDPHRPDKVAGHFIRLSRITAFSRLRVDPVGWRWLQASKALLSSLFPHHEIPDDQLSLARRLASSTRIHSKHVTLAYGRHSTLSQASCATKKLCGCGMKSTWTGGHVELLRDRSSDLCGIKTSRLEIYVCRMC